VNKKFFAFALSIVLIASFATVSIAANKEIIEQIQILLPKMRVIHAEAEFEGERIRIYKAVCEDDKKIAADSSECNIVSRRAVYRGKINGFINGTFVADGKAINDRLTKYGYVEGSFSIYDLNSMLVFRGTFRGAKHLLPTISTEAGISPWPRIWEIEGSMDLTGRGKYSRQNAFLNFEAELTNDQNQSSVKGEMDGVLVLKKPFPIPLPFPIEEVESV